MSCPICHDAIQDVNKVVTECNHVFHFTCIYKNLKTNFNSGEQCPLCRRSFNSANNSSNTCPRGYTPIYRNRYRAPPQRTRDEIRLIIQQRLQQSRANTSRNNIVTLSLADRERRRTLIRKINSEINQLSFENLKSKLREKGLSSRGYLRETLEKRLLQKMIAESRS